MNGGARVAVYFFGAPAGRAASNRWTNAKATTASMASKTPSSCAFALADNTHVPALKASEPVDAAGMDARRRSGPPPVPSRRR